jgi:hypothetical protein
MGEGGGTMTDNGGVIDQLRTVSNQNWEFRCPELGLRIHWGGTQWVCEDKRTRYVIAETPILAFKEYIRQATERFQEAQKVLEKVGNNAG